MYKFPTTERENQKLDGLLHEVQISTWMWEDINMDFIVGFPFTQIQYDSICIVVDSLTKSTHFTPIKSCYSLEDYAKTFIDEIVCSPWYSIIRHIR